MMVCAEYGCTATPKISLIDDKMRMAVLYSLYWVFLGGFQKKEVQKGEIVETSL
jgi:hypothetical protein